LAAKEVYGIEPSTTLNTDEAACRGAALKCAILSPTFRVREFNIVDSVINEITINWSADGTGVNSGSLKIFEKKGQHPFTKAMTIFRKVKLKSRSFFYPWLDGSELALLNFTFDFMF
jgi:molecular chaperone DnaK (HSP70)